MLAVTDAPEAAGGAAPVIAIDGPSGSGKGTVAALVAQRLGWHLLDSGALYRIVACEALDRGLDLDEAGTLAAMARALDIRFDAGGVRVDGRDRTQDLRTEAASDGASRVAALQPVRDAVLDVQRRQRRNPGLVADGRDMGTVVFPDAPLKVFLDASVEERAERRYQQLKGQGESVDRAAVLAALRARDERDRNRPVAPLRPAADAVIIDSSELSVDAVLDRVLQAAADAGLN
ncbi:MAG: (d)CMP kinase [Gammaproteobacteria bacterium]|jgi:cytidylate kinase|nr:(d)CMP kinase [Gammaproteobacteria bacterium]